MPETKKAANRVFEYKDIVLCRFQNSPPWPSRVECNTHFARAAPRNRSHVFFFGTHQVGTVKNCALHPFDRDKALASKCRWLSYAAAVREAFEEPNVEVPPPPPQKDNCLGFYKTLPERQKQKEQRVLKEFNIVNQVRIRVKKLKPTEVTKMKQACKKKDYKLMKELNSIKTAKIQRKHSHKKKIQELCKMFDINKHVRISVKLLLPHEVKRIQQACKKGKYGFEKKTYKAKEQAKNMKIEGKKRYVMKKSSRILQAGNFSLCEIKSNNTELVKQEKKILEGFNITDDVKVAVKKLLPQEVRKLQCESKRKIHDFPGELIKKKRKRKIHDLPGQLTKKKKVDNALEHTSAPSKYTTEGTENFCSEKDSEEMIVEDVTEQVTAPFGDTPEKDENSLSEENSEQDTSELIENLLSGENTEKVENASVHASAPSTCTIEGTENFCSEKDSEEVENALEHASAPSKCTIEGTENFSSEKNPEEMIVEDVTEQVTATFGDTPGNDENLLSEENSEQVENASVHASVPMEMITEYVSEQVSAPCEVNKLIVEDVTEQVATECEDTPENDENLFSEENSEQDTPENSKSFLSEENSEQGSPEVTENVYSEKDSEGMVAEHVSEQVTTPCDIMKSTLEHLEEKESEEVSEEDDEFKLRTYPPKIYEVLIEQHEEVDITRKTAFETRKMAACYNFQVTTSKEKVKNRSFECRKMAACYNFGVPVPNKGTGKETSTNSTKQSVESVAHYKCNEKKMKKKCFAKGKIEQ